MDLDDAHPPVGVAFDAPSHHDASDFANALAAGADHPGNSSAHQLHSPADMDQQHHQHIINGIPSPDRRPKKSSSTCTTCRARKVRCNGARAVCSNCQRLGFPCSYDDVDSSAWSHALPRRRVKQACLSCHSRKARCSGHMPACERCSAQGIECVYRPSKRSRVSSTRLPGDRSSQSQDGGDGDRDDLHDSDAGYSDPNAPGTPNFYHNDIPSPDESFDALIGRTFEKFFRHVHHIPMYSFLHRASLVEQYSSSKVDRALLLALIGITSCLTDMGPGMREYGDRCIDDAEALIFADFTRPSTIKIQALVFMIKHRVLCNKFSSAFMLIGIASRYAAAMRLNHESPTLCFLAQESRRRLMWSLYCIDLSISGGHHDYSLWRPERINLNLPCNERNFEFDLPQPSEKLVPDSNEPREPHAEDIGSLALHIRILHIRQKIIEFTKGVLSSRSVHTGDLQVRVLELHQELDHFANHLPASFQFSDSSLRLRAYSPRICVFVMIHLWWRQCHCDLYRLALVGLRDALPQSALSNFDGSFIEHCQRQCFDHSVAMASIFSAMQKLGAKPVADLDFAICAYQCARMLTYAYHTSGAKFGLTAESVLEQAHVCQRAIKQCCMGPAASGIRADLEKLVTQGLNNNNNNNSRNGASSGNSSPNPNKRTKTSGSKAQQSMSRQSMLRNMGSGEGRASGNTGGAAAPDRPNTPSSGQFAPTPAMSNTTLPPSIISDPWATQTQVTADMLDTSSHEMQVTRGTRNNNNNNNHKGSSNTTHKRTSNASPGMTPPTTHHNGAGTPSAHAADSATPELNNAYEGASFEDITGVEANSGVTPAAAAAGGGGGGALDFAMGMDLNMWVPGAGDWMGGTEFAQDNGGVGA